MAKKIAGVLLAVTVAMTVIFVNTGSAAGYDFDSGSTAGWESLYKNVKVDTSNKYLHLTYTGRSGTGRTYFDYKYDLNRPSGVFQVNYDVMYPKEVEIGGEMQLKYRTGSGSNDTEMVARVGVEYGYFRSQGMTGGRYSLYDLNGERAVAEPGHWYSVKVTVDLDNKQQTIYIYDRNSGELIVHTNPSDTIGGNGRINMISFSGSSEICIDNLEMYSTECQTMYIEAPLYVKSAQKHRCYLFGKDANGRITAPPSGTITWSLDNERDSVSVDTWGKLITGSRPEPGPAIVRVDVEMADGTIMTAKQIVSVSQ